MMRLYAILVFSIVVAGCGKSGGKVTLVNPAPPQAPLAPTTRIFIANANLLGSTVNPSLQTGGTSLRTKSSSAHFRMTSGIGID